ncbi:peptidoglycan-associated lipoprotein Pal [Geotalea sp. SG265]|uniref:peptidoglycan-associated lipoprotein Pal n=1 Tax=Geotalea sp. SG265 TaxID=2922867 RepID=UPI001FAFD027|nr:peptidoglycan-associated lipoprotein Pal [Geotalea sp. SG265]
MKKQVAIGCVFLGLAAVVFNGCAKQGVVKKDEPVLQAAPTSDAGNQVKAALPQEPAKQPQQKHEAKQPAIQPLPQASEIKAALEKVFFAFDSFVLSGDARQALAKNAEILKGDAAMKILIAGNCDERGADEYNLALGEKRAQAAKQYLITMGIPAERLSTISYGKEKPADPEHNEAAWSQNRRDDFVIVR